MRNSAALLIVPIIMVVIVFLLTREEQKKYISNTVIYTGIASGYSIESQNNSRIDFFAVNNAFDNFINITKSRNTLSEVAIHLFAQNMMLNQVNIEYISVENYHELHNLVPEDIKALIDTNSIQRTIDKLYSYMHMNDTNYLYKLLNKDHKHYSLQALKKITIRRFQNSDLVDISYESDDRGICKQTLLLLVEAIVNNYTAIKENQTADVVKYFEEQLAMSEQRLKEAEDGLLKFNQDNKIINYYEQTKYIASQKEDLDLEHQKEQMTLFAAEAVIKNLESKLNSNQDIKLYSNEIMKKRDELSEITSKMTLLEIASVNDTINKVTKETSLNLKAKAEKLKGELTVVVNSLYLSENTIEGIPSEKILEDWLKNVIEYEESKARIVVLNKRRIEFKKVYEIFAPLGATLKRIEREISVAEREYLSLLHSLSLAKLKQQNIELSSNVKMVDEPYFPLEPLASKRKYLIAISGIAGFIMVLFLIVAMEYLDTNISTPENLVKLTGLKIAGVFPKVMNKNNKTDYDFIENRATELLVQNIKLKQIHKKTKPYKILFFSTRVWDGKTTITSKIVNKLRELNNNVLFVTHENKNNEDLINSEGTDAYDVNKSLMNIKSVEELVLYNKDCKPDDYDYIFIVIPAINKNPFPIELINKVDEAYMICRANRAWGPADGASFERIQRAFDNLTPEVILNGVELSVMERIIGELPKRRSKLRILVKKIVKRQFFAVHKME